MKLSEIKTPLFVNVNSNRVQLTDQIITKTCEWFADNAQGCIDEVLSGMVKVNDQDTYIKTKEELKESYLSREFEVGFWFYQKALYIQTGDSVPLLS